MGQADTETQNRCKMDLFIDDTRTYEGKYNHISVVIKLELTH